MQCFLRILDPPLVESMNVESPDTGEQAVCIFIKVKDKDSGLTCLKLIEIWRPSRRIPVLFWDIFQPAALQQKSLESSLGSWLPCVNAQWWHQCSWHSVVWLVIARCWHSLFAVGNNLTPMGSPYIYTVFTCLLCSCPSWTWGRKRD